MNYVISLFLIISSLLLPSCGTLIKTHPEYKGVDPVLQPYVDRYFALSAQHHIVFSNNVTLGIKKLNQGNVIGLCTYGPNFREIDIDLTFWNEALEGPKEVLVFHELTHCYCGRSHDSFDGNYPENAFSKFLTNFKITINAHAGFYEDGCPLSIMYPAILSVYCIIRHQPDYYNEMFERCEPY